MYDQVARRAHISHDVVFDEVAQWNWDKEELEDEYGDDLFSVEYLVMSTANMPQEGVVVDVPGSPVPPSPGAKARYEDGMRKGQHVSPLYRSVRCMC
jgi:hypothetical protein